MWTLRVQCVNTGCESLNPSSEQAAISGVLIRSPNHRQSDLTSRIVLTSLRKKILHFTKHSLKSSNCLPLCSLRKVNLERFQVLCGMANAGGTQVHLRCYTTASSIIFCVRLLVELKLTLLSPFTITRLKTFLLHDLNEGVKAIRSWDAEQIGQTATIQNVFLLLNFTFSKRRTERRWQ